jgi:two-component system, OmpR family, response regulator QseB
MKLLVVEDNRELIDMISGHLTARGFTVDAARTGSEALEHLSSAQYDAMVLDLGLPDMDGMDVLRSLRARAMLPTLILTARDGVTHRIAGLDAGADDYILKPFDLAEFEARLRAVLRRPGLRNAPSLSFADLSIDPSTHTARVGDHAIDLTRQEATLCEALIKNGERITVRDVLAELLAAPGEDFSANAIEAIVSRLRRKLTAIDATVRIETVRGIGYRLRTAAASA